VWASAADHRNGSRCIRLTSHAGDRHRPALRLMCAALVVNSFTRNPFSRARTVGAGEIPLPQAALRRLGCGSHDRIFVHHASGPAPSRLAQTLSRIVSSYCAAIVPVNPRSLVAKYSLPKSVEEVHKSFASARWPPCVSVFLCGLFVQNPFAHPGPSSAAGHSANMLFT